MELDPQVWGAVFPELSERPGSIGTRPILGFRINQIIRDTDDPFGLRLTGLGPSSYYWQPGRNIATCASRGSIAPKPRHQAPAPACACGFYACHDLAALELAWLPIDEDALVLTGVAGTGMVRIHERGWRAQFARIVAFSNEFPELVVGRFSRRKKVRAYRVVSWAATQALEQKYQVPAVSLTELSEVMRAAGDFVEGSQ